MLRAIILFYQLSLKIVQDTSTLENNKMTWNRIEQNLATQYELLIQMKRIKPTLDDAQIIEQFKDINKQIIQGFKNLKTNLKKAVNNYVTLRYIT